MVVGNHCGHCHTIARKIAKSFKPAGSEEAQGGFLEKASVVEGVCIMYEILKVPKSEQR